MKIKNVDILNAREPMKRLLSAKLPIKTSFKIAKLVTELNNQLGAILAVGQGLRETYGEHNPLNGQYEVILPNDKQGRPASVGAAEFAVKYGELMMEEVEIDFEAVILPDTLEIEPNVVIALEKFVTI